MLAGSPAPDPRSNFTLGTGYAVTGQLRWLRPLPACRRVSVAQEMAKIVPVQQAPDVYSSRVQHMNDPFGKLTTIISSKLFPGIAKSKAANYDH